MEERTEISLHRAKKLAHVQKLVHTILYPRQTDTIQKDMTCSEKAQKKRRDIKSMF